MSSAVAQPSWAAPPERLPRLLAGVAPEGRQASLDHHLAAYGAAPHAGPELIDLVERSGLLGRGGGGFPTGRKLAAVAAQGSRPVVVVNAAEGEPTSRKDRLLLRYGPHLVLDGAVLAADTLGARRVTVALGGSDLELRALAGAIGARASRGVDRRVELVPVAVPRAFVAGEETALVRFLNGGPAKPAFTPPRPFERGVGGAPTLVQNAETLAHIALIARFGPEWFRELGTPEEPGSALVSLSGAVNRPGVYEIELGTPLAELLRRAGGESEPLQAFLVGGYFGSWLDSSRVGVPLSDAALVPLGASLGARAIIALPKESCGLVETARVARYLAAESAGQCGPCVNGLDAIAGGLVRLATGKADSRDDLRRWVAAIRGRGACRHPDGAAAFAASALTCFADEVELHLRGRCSASSRSVLQVPRGDQA